MARLNEAPFATENVEALKRRFVRQNRELAKVNSNQSLRIRTLECEQSRLLGENLNLREEILRLQNQLSDAHSSTNVHSIDSIRGQLQAKIEEFGKLVADLGCVQKPERYVREQDPSSWRPKIPQLHLAGQEPRLPSILEDKSYPRRTLEPEEIRALRLSDQSNESPDLGPPPVAHFDCEEPIKFDARPIADAGTLPSEKEEVETILADLAINLETRKKRKESSTKSSLRRNSLFEEATEEQPAPRLKTSAKRKLHVREEEDTPTSVLKDDFKFSRKGAGTEEATGNESSTESTMDDTHGTINVDVPMQVAESGPRRVLGDKSVNMSPKKRMTTKCSNEKNATDKPPQADKDSEKAQDGRGRRPRERPNHTVTLQKESKDPVVDVIELPCRPNADLPPTTPAVDMLSPMPSEPSTIKHAGADTPPPGNLVPGGDGTNRPSRRVRSAVNYAEPSLNTKMRRPTKDLVDAIVIKSGNSGDTRKPMRTVVIKREDDSVEGWRDELPISAMAESNSPLGSKTGNPDHQRSKSEGGQQNRSTERSASGAAINALSKQRTKPDQPVIKPEPHDAGQQQTMDDLPVYEPKKTSPTIPQPRRVRRHSSVSDCVDTFSTKLPSPKSDYSFASSSPVTEASSTLIRSSSASTLSNAQGNGRLERAGGRRRSMML